MKKLLSSLAVLSIIMLSALNADAQHMYLGARVGANLANELTTLPPGFTHSIHTGFLGGAEYEYWFNSSKYWSGTSWGFDAQVLYDQKGRHEDIDNPSGTEDAIFNYIEVPILVKARFRSGSVSVFEPYVFAGPSFGVFLSGTINSHINGSAEAKTPIPDSELNSPDISALLGAGFAISLSSGSVLTFDAAYALGLVNIDKILPIENIPVVKSRDIRIAAGILFPLN